VKLFLKVSKLSHIQILYLINETKVKNNATKNDNCKACILKVVSHEESPFSTFSLIRFTGVAFKLNKKLITPLSFNFLKNTSQFL